MQVTASEVLERGGVTKLPPVCSSGHSKWRSAFCMEFYLSYVCSGTSCGDGSTGSARGSLRAGAKCGGYEGWSRENPEIKINTLSNNVHMSLCAATSNPLHRKENYEYPRENPHTSSDRGSWIAVVAAATGCVPNSAPRCTSWMKTAWYMSNPSSSLAGLRRRRGKGPRPAPRKRWSSKRFSRDWPGGSRVCRRRALAHPMAGCRR